MWLVVFHSYHAGHVIMFVPCQHEIPGSCNSKHKTDADFGQTGIKTWLNRHRVSCSTSLTNRGWEDDFMVFFMSCSAYKSGWLFVFGVVSIIIPVWFWNLPHVFPSSPHYLRKDEENRLKSLSICSSEWNKQPTKTFLCLLCWSFEVKLHSRQ